jgi:hypothetical protein
MCPRCVHNFEIDILASTVIPSKLHVDYKISMKKLCLEINSIANVGLRDLTLCFSLFHDGASYSNT